MPTNGEVWNSVTPAEQALVGELRVLEEKRDRAKSTLEEAVRMVRADEAIRDRARLTFQEFEALVAATRHALQALGHRKGVTDALDIDVTAVREANIARRDPVTESGDSNDDLTDLPF